MNATELAKNLNDREYGKQLDNIDLKEVAEAGLVIAYGESDDILTFKGAIDDDIDAYDGGIAFLQPSGLIKNICDDNDCPYHKKESKNGIKIVAEWWDNKGWFITTDIYFIPFDIMEDGERICRGIVFRMDDLKKAYVEKWNERALTI